MKYEIANTTPTTITVNTSTRLPRVRVTGFYNSGDTGYGDAAGHLIVALRTRGYRPTGAIEVALTGELEGFVMGTMILMGQIADKLIAGKDPHITPVG